MQFDSNIVRGLEHEHGEGRQAGKLPAAAKLSVFPSRDFTKIRELCTHPRIYPHISDDHSDRTNFPLPDSESVRYLLCSDERGVFGFVIFIAQNWSCWSAHVGFLPRSYGSEARRAFADAIAWMWKHTPARRLTGEILRENTLAIRFARAAGFEFIGINRKSKKIGGVMRDQVLLGLSKPE